MSSEDSSAIQDLNRRLRTDPNDATALYRRGQLYAKNDDFSRAISDFDAAIRLNPRDAEALNNRCWVRAIIGDLYAALQDCDASLQIKPDLVDSLDSRGFVQAKVESAAERNRRLRCVAASVRKKGIVAVWTRHCQAAGRRQQRQ